MRIQIAIVEDTCHCFRWFARRRGDFLLLGQLVSQLQNTSVEEVMTIFEASKNNKSNLVDRPGVTDKLTGNSMLQAAELASWQQSVKLLSNFLDVLLLREISRKTKVRYVAKSYPHTIFKDTDFSLPGMWAGNVMINDGKQDADFLWKAKYLVTLAIKNLFM